MGGLGLLDLVKKSVEVVVVEAVVEAVKASFQAVEVVEVFICFSLYHYLRSQPVTGLLDTNLNERWSGNLNRWSADVKCPGAMEHCYPWTPANRIY